MAQVTIAKWTNCVEDIKKVKRHHRQFDDKFIIHVSDTSDSDYETDCSIHCLQK